MSALCNNFVSALLRHYFQNVAQSGIGDSTGLLPSAAPGNLYFGLHAADPGDAGDQTTNEINYTGYARVPVARSSAGFNVSSKSVGPVNEVGFGKRTDTGAATTAYFFSIGTAASGAGNLILRGAIGTAPLLFTAVGTQLTSPGHNLSVNAQITVAVYEGTALPTGITEGQVLWVQAVSGDSFSVSATQGGAAIAFSTAGQGSFQRLTPLTITQNTTPKLDPQTLIKFQ